MTSIRTVAHGHGAASHITTHTLEQANDSPNRAILAIVHALDWYGSDASVAFTYDGVARTPLFTFADLGGGTHTQIGVYFLNSADLPETAGSKAISYGAASYYPSCAILELNNCPQAGGLLTINRAAASVNLAYASFAADALDLCLAWIRGGSGYDYAVTPGHTSVLDVPVTEGVNLLASHSPSADSTFNLGFTADYGTGALDLIRIFIPVLAQSVIMDVLETDQFVETDLVYTFTGTQVNLDLAELQWLPEVSAPGYQISDVGVLAGVVDPHGDQISGEIFVAPTAGDVTMTPAGNIYYYPWDDESVGDTFMVRPWSHGIPASTYYEVSISFDEFAVAPTFTSSPVTSVNEGSTYTYNGTVSDANADPITVTATAKPSWLTLTQTGPGTFTLTGTPPIEDIDDYPIQLRVTDSWLSGYQVFDLHVNRAPFLQSSQSITGNDWTDFTHTHVANKLGVFFAVGGDAAVTIDSSSGVATHAYASGGVKTYTVSLTLGGRTREYTITATVDGQPIYTTGTTVYGDGGVFLTFEVRAHDPEGNALTYSKLSGTNDLVMTQRSAPSGGDYIADIFGVLAEGTYPWQIQVTAANGSGVATQNLTFVIGDGGSIELPVLTVLGPNPKTQLLGVAYTDAGAEASYLGTNLTADIVTEGVELVDVDTPGSYTVTYRLPTVIPELVAYRLVVVVDPGEIGSGGGSADHLIETSLIEPIVVSLS